jgi:hypothetical protein
VCYFLRKKSSTDIYTIGVRTKGDWQEMDDCLWNDEENWARLVILWMGGVVFTLVLVAKGKTRRTIRTNHLTWMILKALAFAPPPRTTALWPGVTCIHGRSYVDGDGAVSCESHPKSPKKAKSVY